MAKRFYYQVMGEMFGPVSGIELRDRAMAGDVTTDTLVRINEEGDWVLASRLKNLFDERGLPISHSAILGPPPRPQTDETSGDGESARAESQRAAPATSDSPSDGIDFKPDDTEAATVADLPDVPALYALYSGCGDALYPVFVGTTGDLRVQIEQQLVRNDFRGAAGTAAVSINAQYVTEVRWWTHPGFLQKQTMEAAQLVAHDVLEPAVRSESGISDAARTLYSDAAFVTRMTELVNMQPAGHLAIRSLEDAWAQLDIQGQQLAELEQRLAQLEGQ